MNEQDFVQRIVRQLDQGLNDLPSGLLYRLRLARGTALSRAHTQSVAAQEQAGWVMQGGTSARLLNRRVLVSVVGLILGLSAVLFWQQSSRQADYAELDAQVLTDELPMTAYLDTGFEIWLYHHTSD